eukprot:TRINITY_DN61789_c0_g1_i1.p1 TRINITY_DN61789_c0_g1~~TRINITY_DN61789_c0_g1_i1.p1  ORF type:complete len:862 (-),score=180.33 TRINITY_DN61789_c0_g1_i1:34-2475(-)
MVNGSQHNQQLLRIAPWLPERRRPSCLEAKLRGMLGLLGALLLLLYVIIVGILLLLVAIPRLLLRLLLRPAAGCFGYVVEYAYALRICRLHVSIVRFVQNRWVKRPYHSRFDDLRTELRLVGGGICFVHAVPCLSDNFCYVLVDATAHVDVAPGVENDIPGSGLPTLVVDPCDATAVEEALEHLADRFYRTQGGLHLEAVLCTHKHWDHAGGNEQLAARASAEAARTDEESDASTAPPLSFACPLKVFGGLEDDVPGCTHPIQHGDHLQVGSLVMEAVAAPGHTVGSVMFRLMCEEPERLGAACSTDHKVEALFTGDTLFSGGCGAQFEGSELDMQHCFATILEGSAPSAETLLFPGHEYTAMLLENGVGEALATWAPTEPPGRFMALCSAFYVASHRRALRDKLPTVPVSLAGERMVNPMFDYGLQKHVQTLLSAVAALEDRGQSNASTDEDGKTQGDSLPATVSFPVSPGAPLSSACSDNEGQSYLVDTRAAPSQQLAVLYRADLETLRQELLSGKLGGAEAADKLLKLEQRPFEDTLLTGGEDSFGDHGLQPEEEYALEEESEGVAQEARVEDPSSAADTDDSGVANEGRTSAPSELQLKQAMKVLAVPAFVAVGHKAPCREGELPVSLFRLEAVLKRLQVPAPSLSALLQALERPGAGGSGSSSSEDAAAASCGARCCCCPSARIFRQAGTSEEEEDAYTAARLLPLRCALRSLLPEAAQQVGFLRSFLRWCSKLRCCSGRPSSGTSESRPEESSGQEEASGSEPEQPPPLPEGVLRRRRLAAVERRFAKHRPEGCPLCTSSFRQSAAL